MNLSEHFTLEELTASQTAMRRGINNTPNDEVIGNLTKLAETLEQVRALVDAPINISSGYRSVPLNTAIGGSSSSAHCRGLAADFTVSGVGVKELAIMIRDSGIEFDQLICEFDSWVHIGLSEGEYRNQCLTARHGSHHNTQYLQGIV